MEYKSRPAELKIAEDGLTIVGYASTFGGEPDSYGDIVDRGAFKKTIKERFPKGSIKMLWQHREPLGMPVELTEDSRGLHFEAKITDTQFGRDCLAYIKDGVVNTMSIGYSTIKHEIDDGGDDEVRHLKEVKLFEISPVTFPANENATITGVKELIDRQLKPFKHLFIDPVKRVIPFQNLSLGSREARWQSTQAERRVRAWADAEDGPNEKYRSAFLWFDSENPDNFTSYKLQIGDIVDGRMVALPRGIFAVAGVLMGARGGVDIPESDQDSIRRQLNRYYAKMREEFDDDTIIAPWNRSIDTDDLDEKAGRILSAANIKITKNTLKSLDECTSALKAMLEAAEPVEDTTSGKGVNPADGIGQLISLRERIKNIKV